MQAQQRRQKQRVAAQAKAIDTAAVIAVTIGLGILSTLAGLATLIH